MDISHTRKRLLRIELRLTTPYVLLTIMTREQGSTREEKYARAEGESVCVIKDISVSKYFKYIYYLLLRQLTFDHLLAIRWSLVASRPLRPVEGEHEASWQAQRVGLSRHAAGRALSACHPKMARGGMLQEATRAPWWAQRGGSSKTMRRTSFGSSRAAEALDGGRIYRTSW